MSLIHKGKHKSSGASSLLSGQSNGLFSLSRYKLKTVQARFIVFLMILILVPFAITVTTLEWLHYQRSYQQLSDKLEHLSANQSIVLAEPVFNDDKDQIRLTVSSLLSDPDIEAIEIFDKDGKRAYSFGIARGDYQRLIKVSNITYAWLDQIQKVGSIKLTFTDKNIRQSITMRLYERSLVMIVFILVLISAYIALRYTVGRTLKKIIDTIDNDDQHGLLMPVEWQSNDELGRVVKAFNVLQKQHGEDTQALHQAHAQLEQRVQQRTESLSQEISARNQVEIQLRLREQELNDFINGVPVMLWMIEPDGGMRFNDSWLAFTGNSMDQEIAIEWDGSDIHPDFRHQCQATYHRAIGQRQPYQMEYLCKRHDNEYRWIAETGRPRFDLTGEYRGYFGTCTDITDRKLTEQQLFEEKERAQVTLHSIGEGVITTDAQAKVRYLNPVAEQLIGLTLSQVLTKPLSDVLRIIDEGTRKAVPDLAKQCLKEQRVISEADSIILISHDDNEYFIQNSVAPIYDQFKQIIGTVLVFADVSKSRLLAKELSYQASHDSLTGLINRRELERRLQKALVNSRNGGNQHALLYMDLDQFKIINDTCGHVAGDDLLKRLANMFASILRISDSDSLARLGGDEFGLLLQDCPPDKAEQLANKFCQSVASFHFTWQDKSYAIGVSIGVAALTSQTTSIDQLLIDADTACYAAKDAGRSCVYVYNVDDETVAKRYGEMQWVNQINMALEQDHFQLYCQPILPLRNQNSSHYEILIRLQKEDGLITLPGAFLPAAENYGLMYLIDRWVITKAFAWIKANLGNISTESQFSINLSGQSLAEKNLLPFILDIFERTQLPKHCICFEITETAAIANMAMAIEFINVLKAQGVCFALDDFGTGLSSFAYLKQLPVDYLKIDGFFVKGMNHDPIDLEMVRSIQGIGKVMGIKTVAEGVEHKESIDILREIGVDFVQGFVVGKPKPLDALLDN